MTLEHMINERSQIQKVTHYTHPIYRVKDERWSGAVDGVGSGGGIQSSCSGVGDFFQGDDNGLQLIVLMAAHL